RLRPAQRHQPGAHSARRPASSRRDAQEAPRINLLPNIPRTTKAHIRKNIAMKPIQTSKPGGMPRLVTGANPRLGSMHFAEWLSRTTTQKTATEKRSAPASNLSGQAAKGV